MKNQFIRKLFNLFSIQQLTIRQRLTFFICLLLFAVTTISTVISYYTIKKVSVRAGETRLVTVTNQLSSMLGQSTTTMLNRVRIVADNDSIKKCLQSGGQQFREEALEKMLKLQIDSTYIFVDLLDKNFTSVLHTSQSFKNFDLNLKASLSPLPVADTVNEVGKLYAQNDSVYYPVVVSVTDKKQVIGYIVNWRTLTSTRRKVNELSSLLGAGAVIYIVNKDGSVWSDMIERITPPSINSLNSNKVFAYYERDKLMEASTEPVANSNWIVFVGFSQEALLKPVYDFLKYRMVLAIIFIVAGFFMAGVISNNITKPLKQLNIAANAISAGDYSPALTINRRDELGQLAYAFTLMTREIQQMQANLEKKVMERTAQLEAVNKELESFSYSVSHDLKAPLRAVSGYTQIIINEYGNDADEELKRLYCVIQANAKQMTTLIDDLLNFSRLGRKEIEKRSINMTVLCENVLEELKPNSEKIKLVTQCLPNAVGDYSMLKQVFINLISNALKYSSKKQEAVIEIGSENTADENIYYIKDNGVGFDMQYEQKLFGVFQRLHGQNEFEGNGVGLALVKKIIAKHGGRVWAKSELNKGAIFYFSLPK